MSGWSYKHGIFTPWITRLQAKESEPIPEEVMEFVIESMKDSKKFDPESECSKSEIRDILKGQNTMLQRLHQNRIDITTPHRQEILRISDLVCSDMEKDVPPPEECIPFQLYEYIFYRICQLLGYHQYTGSIHPNFEVFDEWWIKICQRQGWFYYTE